MLKRSTQTKKNLKHSLFPAKWLEIQVTNPFPEQPILLHFRPHVRPSQPSNQAENKGGGEGRQLVFFSRAAYLGDLEWDTSNWATGI